MESISCGTASGPRGGSLEPGGKVIADTGRWKFPSLPTLSGSSGRHPFPSSPSPSARRGIAVMKVVGVPFTGGRKRERSGCEVSAGQPPRGRPRDPYGGRFAGSSGPAALDGPINGKERIGGQRGGRVVLHTVGGTPSVDLPWTIRRRVEQCRGRPRRRVGGARRAAALRSLGPPMRSPIPCP